jgi:hypothetical protein
VGRVYAETGVVRLLGQRKTHQPRQRFTTAGTATLLLALTVPAAGTYGFDVWLRDEAGNESNHLTGTLEAQ